MRELTMCEIENVSGGDFPQISGYQGAAAIGTVLAMGAKAAAVAGAVTLGPVVVGVAIGAAAGLVVAQAISDLSGSEETDSSAN